LVVAGPGTGKTEVITRRVAWLIATKRALPSEVLALTFTDRAADEMQARVDELVPYGHAEAAVHTFHAFGDRLVREFGYELGLPVDVRVISRAEAVVLLRENVFALGLERYRPLADPTRFLGALVDRCARAKEEGLSPADLQRHADAAARAGTDALAAATDDESRAAAVARCEEAAAERELAVAFEAYQRLLVERGLVDFGDQVAIALRLLRERPAVRAGLQRRYRYVVVDESQDTDPVQLELLSLLAGPRRNVTVVGDDDQSIYAFRGTAHGDMAGFEQRFPGATGVRLRRNHRSLSPILTAAHRLIGHNDPPTLPAPEGRSALVSVRRPRAPAPVRCRPYVTVDDEADAVASEISRRVASGASPRDFAVLVRTNADASPFLKSLALQGVPVRFSGATGLYARPEVRELLSFLRTVADPDSTVDLYGVATGSPYQLGGADLTAILEMARRRHRSLWSVMAELEDPPRLLRLSEDTRRRLGRLRSELRAAVDDSHRRPAGEVLYEHLKRSGRLRDLVADADRGREAPLRNVARLFDIVRAQSAVLDDDRIPFLARHLQTLAASGDDPAEPEAELDEDSVAVLTVHKAKGLEFRCVFLVGLVDGRFPLRGRGDRLPRIPALGAARVAPATERPHAEERRLFYVAMTRARDELHLSWSRLTGAGRRRRPSPFIAEALDRSAEDDSPASPVAPGDALAARIAAGLDRSATVERPVASRGAGVSGPLSLSFSQIDDYLSCPLKYRLRHVVRVPTPPHHALVLGNALHQAAAAFHNAAIRGRPFGEADLLAVFDAHWSSEGFLSRDHEEARYARGRAALVRFREDQLRPGASVPVAVERPFAVNIGRDMVRGRYDRVDESGDGVVITDYKSSDVREDARADQKARDSLQLQVYALAHEAETGRLPAAVQLHFLDSGVVGRAAPDPARLAKARARIEEAASGIRAGEFVARPDPVGCGFCPYREVCPSSAA
jgi:DNA helicase-2/ATP-dependent DNA helicase PcrA